jgi:phosphoribosylformylglycinamidine synthase
LKARVTIGLKPGVLDVQGKAMAESLLELGFSQVTDARVGKVVELELGDAAPEAAHAAVTEMCERLLANTVIETYKIEIAS